MNNDTSAAGLTPAARKPARKLFYGVKETYSPPVSEFSDKNGFAWERIYAKGAKKPRNVSKRRETFRFKDWEYVEIVSINWFHTEAKADRHYAERRREIACENHDEFDEYYDPEYDGEYDWDEHCRSLQIDADLKYEREHGIC
jgi:hypothetical protein